MEQLANKISTLLDKASKLSSKYDESLEANKKLAEENRLLKNSVTEKEKQILTLEEELKMLKLSSSLKSEGGKQNTEIKRKINEYIKEIDKCIALIKT